MTKNRKFLNWEVGYSESKESLPKEWVKAEVPGAVQLDWARAKKYTDYKIADNYKQFGWMEDKYWVYKSKFRIENFDKSKSYHLISKGIDYEFIIYLNDKNLLNQEGMYKRVDINITDILEEENQLLIIVFPAPKIYKEPHDRTQVSQSCKPAASYGWDWHPRLIPLGIWDETFIEIRPKSHIYDIKISYELSNTLNNAILSLDVFSKNCMGKKYKVIIKSPMGEVKIVKGTVTEDIFLIQIPLENLALWYPAGYGVPNLYEFKIKIFDNDIEESSAKRKIGFRKVRLIMNEGAWKEPEEFPKTRSIPPVQVEINNVKVFCKGSNWVMPEIFYGTISNERYEEMIDLAIGANFNMLRLWGGAIVNKDFFYEYCDEKGIMVWQEFPLACNDYFDSREYLAVLESEAEAIVNRLKKHPCIIIWCGGNELFNSWSGMTDQSLAIRLLNKITFEKDPNTPFIPTSPIMGMGHGYYLFRNDKTSEDVFEIYNDLRFSALTEFGVPSASMVEVIEEIIPKEELWPPKNKGSWMEHHAFHAWDGERDSWLNLKTIERYFGAQENLEELVENSQFLQAVGLKYIYEEARRQQPYCSMASNWCFNDCWPSAANTSIICYPNIPKKAYDSVRAACRPKIASARIEKFEWSQGEEFIADLFILNDSLSFIDQGSVSVFLITEKDKLKIHSWNYPEVGSQQNIKGPKINFRLPDLDSKRFSISLEDEENHQLNSEYFLLFKKTD